MGEDFTYTTFPMQENPSVLKVTTPDGYTEKDATKLHENIKKQVGNLYLVVTVPKGVDLEIIV